MKKLILTLLFLPFIVFSQDKKSEKRAVESAKFWLLKVDNGDYSESWNISGEYFQNSIQEDRWFAAMKASREPLGKVISRNIKSASYLTEISGAPDGEYFIIEFDVSYANKKVAIETVTPTKEKDGKWKVVGYYIR